jgi:hypothetical protein
VNVNSFNPNHLPMSAVLVRNASHGSVAFNANGSFSYTPNAHYTGSDSFTYYATDSQYDSNVATVSINVQDTGTISVQPASYSILHDQVLSVDATTGVLANMRNFRDG